MGGAPKSTSLPTRGGLVAIVAVSPQSGSPALTTSSLPVLGEPVNEGLGSSGQRTVITMTTVRGSVITVYGPLATGVDSGPTSSGVIDANPPTGKTVSPASLPENTTLVKVPMETGQSGREVCAWRMRKRSILMG